MNTVTRILIAEDNLADAGLNKEEALKVLEQCVFEVVETRKDFLEKLESFQPHLVLSDYSMPSFDGLTVLALTKEFAPDTPVIIVTGSVNEDTAVECMKAGASNYVIKEHLKRLAPAILHALSESERILEHKKAQKALSESEFRYHNLFSLSPVGIIVQDENNVIIDVNDCYCKNTGYKKEELIGHQISVTIPENEIQHININKQKILNGEQIKHEVKCIKKNGSVFFAEFTETLITLPGGVQGIMSIAADISHRKIAEKELEDKNKNLQLLSRYAITLTEVPADGDYAIIIPNEIKQMTGAVYTAYSEYDSKEKVLITRHVSAEKVLLNSIIKLAGKRIMNVKSPVDEKAMHFILENDNAVFNSFTEITFGSIPELLDKSLKLLTGINRFYALAFNLGDELFGTLTFGLRKNQPDPDKKMLSSIARLTSLTLRRKKVEEELKEREERLRNILNSTQDAMIIIDETGAISLWNHSAEIMFGYSEGETSGKHIQDMLVPDRFRNQYLDGFKKIIDKVDTSVTSSIIELAAKRKNGEEFPVEVASSVLYINNSKYLVGSVRDITARRIAEIDFIRSEKRYHELFDSYKDGIAVIGIEPDASVSSFLELNDAAASMLGYSRDEMLRIPLSSLESGHNEQSIIKRRSEIDQNGVCNFETEFIHKSGKLIPVEVSVSLINYTGVPALLNIVKDISERKFRDKLLKMQYNIANAVINADTLYDLYEAVRTELAVLLDTRNFFIAFLNRETGMLNAPFEKEEKDSVNEWPAAKSLTGKVIADRKPVLLGRNEISAMAEAGEINIIGTRSEKWLGVPLFSAKKAIGAIVVQSYDNPDAYNQDSVYILELVAHELSNYISRKEADQKALTLSKAIEQNPVTIVITNKEGLVEYVNPKFSEVTGYSRAEAIGRMSDILKTGVENQHYYQNLWSTITAGKDWQGEIISKKKSGENYWENALISPIKNELEEITHFVVVSEDITEKKSIVEELKIAKEKAEESDRLKTAFLQNISHEIRTPLNGILGFSELLIQDWTSPEERIEYNEAIQISGKRLIEIISNVLDISIIETGQIILNPENFSLNEMFQNLYNFYHSQAIQKNLQLDYITGCKDTECSIVADQSRINQVMMNLINNALKYTKKGGVNFSYKLENDQVVFNVCDTGIGIDVSHHRRIFTRFYQADHSTARSYEGAGLGLSISHGLVTAMGGTIWFESEAGSGASFSFSIPVKKSHEKAGSAIPSGEFSSEENIVLIADDDNTSYLLLTTTLKKRKVIIVRAETGVEAIEMVKRHENIKLILMDVKMPEMDGLEATRLIKLMKPDIPVIMQTAYAFSEDIAEAYAAGCNDYLSKPIAADKLKQVYDTYLGKENQ